VSIESFSDFYDRFIDLEFVFVKIYGVIKKLFINNVEVNNKTVLIQFRNFDSAAYAEPLVGLRIYVDEQSSIKLDGSVHYIHDLIDCELIYNNQLQGKLKDIYILKSNDVYVVETVAGKEVLLPGIDDYVENIDIKKKKIRLKHDMESIFLDED
jgi:16S rRNA processing protein RimM